MPVAATLIIRVAELEDSSKKFQISLAALRSSLRHVPEKDAGKAETIEQILNQHILQLKNAMEGDLSLFNKGGAAAQDTFTADDVKAINGHREMNPAEIQSEFHRRQWFPKNRHDFLESPFDVYRGITASDPLDRSESCLIHPLSLFAQSWNSIYRIWLLIYALLLPLGIAYPSRQVWLIPISLVLAVFKTIEVVIQLNMGFIQDQELEMSKKAVWSYHLKKHTIIQSFFSAFPYIIITQLSTAALSYSRDYSNLICLINAYTLIESSGSLQVSLVGEKFREIIQRYEINKTMVTLVLILFGTAYYWHCYVCSVIFLTNHGAITDLYPDLLEADLYVLEFFNAGSMMFSSGWGVAGPVETIDRIPKLINMVFLAFLFCLFTANITTYMIRLDSSGRQFAEKLEEVSQYIMYKQLGNDLRDKIFHYYHFKYNKGKYFDEQKILSELNRPLQVSIAMRQCAPLIAQVPFFREADHSFLAQIVPLLQVAHYLHEDVIIEANTTGDTMYFIESGSVEIISQGKSVTVLHPGQFFGEISLLFGNMKRTATVRAITECVLYSLSQSDLSSIIEINPTMAQNMRKIAEQRLKENKVHVVVPEGNRRGSKAPFVDQTYSVAKQPENNILPPENFVSSPSGSRNNLSGSGNNLHDPIKVALAMASAQGNSYISSRLSSEVLHQNIAKNNSIIVPKFDHPDVEQNISDILPEPTPLGAQQKTKSIQNIQSEEISQFVNNARKKSMVHQFMDLEFVDKHVNPLIPHPPMQEISTNAQASFVDVANKRKSRFMSVEMKHLQDELNLANSPPIEEEKSEAIASDVKKEEKEGSLADLSGIVDKKVLASKEVLSPGVIIGINDGDNSNEEDDDEFAAPTKKVVRKNPKNMEQAEMTKDRDEKIDKLTKRTMWQEINNFYHKYQPSLSYCPIHPTSGFSSAWNSILEVSFAIVIILLPLSLSLQSYSTILPGLSIFVCIVTALHILIKIQTGLPLAQEVEMEPMKIIRIYTRDGTFFLDFITVIPWVFIVDACTTANSSSRYFARLVCIVHGLPFIRCVMSNNSSWLGGQMTSYIRRNDVNISAVQAFKILAVMIIYWHWHSCAVNFLIQTQSIPIYNMAYSVYTEFDSYTLHFWSAATEMLNTGCGVDAPRVTLDRWLKIFNMIFNTTLLSLFVGNISSFMIGLDSSGRQFNEQLEQVSQYITYKGLGRALKKKIMDYYQLKYSRGKYFDEQKILAELNAPLRLAIYMRECRALIIQVPFFKGADPGFISQVVMVLKPAHFLPDDLVIERGTAGDMMFFIASGTLDVISDGKIVSTLKPGQFFGEIALLFGHMKRTASIKATSACTLYSLARHELEFILEVYPEMAENLQKVAERRLEEELGRRTDANLAAKKRMKNDLFNSDEELDVEADD